MFGIRILTLCVSLGTSTATDLCSSVSLTLGGSCSVLSTTSFKLTAPTDSCLTYGGYSFDGNSVVAGSVTPENVCRLALYGNQAPTYEAPFLTKETCFGTLLSGSARSHWFGRCGVGGCSSCTNSRLLEGGVDWTSTYSVGDTCGVATSDGDLDECWSAVSCFFESVPTPAPTQSPQPSVSPQPTPVPSSCSGGASGLAAALSPAAAAVYEEHTLFARTTAVACAESLSYGLIDLSQGECSDVFDAYPGFLSTAQGSAYHDQWWQVVVGDHGWGSPVMHIFYKFTDLMTLQDRFRIAAASENEGGGGVGVEFEVWNGDMDRMLASFTDATYAGASNAFASSSLTPGDRFAQAEAAGEGVVLSGFSDDDWCWGAGSGIVDCNSVNNLNPGFGVVYGVAVSNGDDSECGLLHNGTSSSSARFAATPDSSGSLVTYLFLREVPAPPTPAPTTFYCDPNDDSMASWLRLLGIEPDDDDDEGLSGEGVFAIVSAAACLALVLFLIGVAVGFGRYEEEKLNHDAQYHAWLRGGGGNHPSAAAAAPSSISHLPADFRVRAMEAEIAQARARTREEMRLRRAPSNQSFRLLQQQQQPEQGLVIGDAADGGAGLMLGEVSSGDEEADLAAALAASTLELSRTQDVEGQTSAGSSASLQPTLFPPPQTQVSGSIPAASSAPAVQARAPAAKATTLVPTTATTTSTRSDHVNEGVPEYTACQGPLSDLAVWVGLGPALLVLAGSLALAYFFNGRRAGSAHPLPGIRCTDKRIAAGGALLCIIGVAIMLLQCLFLFVGPLVSVHLKKYLAQSADSKRRRAALLRFHATSKHCIQCVSRPANVLFLPCAHLYMCMECYEASQSQPSSSSSLACSTCRAAVRKVVRVRLPLMADEPPAWFINSFNARDPIGNNDEHDGNEAQPLTLHEARSEHSLAADALSEAHYEFSRRLCRDCSSSGGSRPALLSASRFAFTLSPRFWVEGSSTTAMATRGLSAADVREAALETAEEAQRLYFHKRTARHGSGQPDGSKGSAVGPTGSRGRRGRRGRRRGQASEEEEAVGSAEQVEHADAVALAACRADAVYVKCGHCARCWDCAVKAAEVSLAAAQEGETTATLSHREHFHHKKSAKGHQRRASFEVQLSGVGATSGGNRDDDDDDDDEEEDLEDPSGGGRGGGVGDSSLAMVRLHGGRAHPANHRSSRHSRSTKLMMDALALAADEHLASMAGSPTGAAASTSGAGSSVFAPSAVSTSTSSSSSSSSAPPPLVGECNICDEVSAVVRAQWKTECPICLDSISIEDVFCAGPCGHVCCVACANKYVRSSLGDVGNCVSGDGLRCLFHSTMATAGGTKCRGILEPTHLKALVGRPGKAALRAAITAAYSPHAVQSAKAAQAEAERIKAQVEASAAATAENHRQQQQRVQQQQAQQQQQDSMRVRAQLRGSEQAVIRQAEEESEVSLALAVSLSESVTSDGSTERASAGLSADADQRGQDEGAPGNSSQAQPAVPGRTSGSSSSGGGGGGNAGGWFGSVSVPSSTGESLAMKSVLEATNAFIAPPQHPASAPKHSGASSPSSTSSSSSPQLTGESPPKRSQRARNSRGESKEEEKEEISVAGRTHEDTPAAEKPPKGKEPQRKAKPPHKKGALSSSSSSPPPQRARSPKAVKTQNDSKHFEEDSKDGEGENSGEESTPRSPPAPPPTPPSKPPLSSVGTRDGRTDPSQAHAVENAAAVGAVGGGGGGGGRSVSTIVTPVLIQEEEEEEEPPMTKEEIARLGRFVYEAGIPLNQRFYCCNSSGCNRLFEVPETLLDETVNHQLSKEECKVICPFCEAASCARCKILFHGAMTCEEIKQMEEDRKTSGEGGKSGRGAVASMKLIEATSKPCPSCKIQISHYHGHACHHIAPGTGCVNCGYHFCFSCLAPAGPSLGPNDRQCSCPQFCDNDNVLQNMIRQPVPMDSRCGCVFCPDCYCEIMPVKSGHVPTSGTDGGPVAGEGMVVVPHPCENCDGTCVVCIGLVVPGGGELSINSHTGRVSVAL